MIKESKEIEKSLYVVSTAPYLKSEDTISGIMNSVSIALLPSALSGVYLFGMTAFITLSLSICFSLFWEYAFKRISGSSSTIHDGSALLTGLLLGMNLPPFFPWWGIFAGSFFTIVICKHFFGGLGFNIFNPALSGRVFLLLSWPVHMSHFQKPLEKFFAVDALTQATPLTAIKTIHLSNDPEATIASIVNLQSMDLLLGHRAGSIGEVSIVALLIGGVYLLFRRVITWHIPVSMILSSAIFSFIFHLINPLQAASPIFHILNGGLILGAFFMATDYVTSPYSHKGMVIFGAGCGFLTILIRQYGSYPEGVSFAILIMNIFVPMIDKYVKPSRFGGR